jgi:hypothetical protein
MQVLEELREIGKKLGAEPIPHVPCLGKFKLCQAIAQNLPPGSPDALPATHAMEAILRMAEGPSLNPQVTREGLVFKSCELVNGESISFKVVSNKYLLQE